MNKVRLGIIGLGNIGRFHATYLLDGKIDRCELTAVCDAFPKATEAYAEKGLKVFTDGEEFIKSGEIDAAILATPPDTDGLQAIPLYTEPFRLVFPDGHALSSLAHLRMGDVDRNDILLLTEGHCFRDQALAICDAPTRKNARNTASLRATSLETLINLVAQGQGVTLVPSLAMRSLSDDLHLQNRALDDEGAARDINLTIRRSTPRRALAGRIAEVIQSGLPDSIKLPG